MLDRLDAAESDNPAKNKRTMPRVQFRKNDISVRIYHPGGSVSSSVVSTRNLSAGGVSFLYHGFLYKNTRVEIIVKRRLGGDDMICGIVTHCALVNRVYHLIGVRFDNKIFPKLYLDPSEWGVLDDSSTVDPTSLTGTVLHLDDQQIDRSLLAHFLKGTKVNLLSAATIDDAVEMMKEHAVDCVLCDLNLTGETSELAMMMLRQVGFSGPIGVISAETSPARLKAIREGGAGAVLTKPYDAQRLISLLSTWLTAGASGEDAIYSTLANQESMRPLITQYVDRIRVMSGELRKNMIADKHDAVRAICQSIKGTGTGFGFPYLSEVAGDAVKALDDASNTSEILMQLQRLEGACRRVSSKTA